MIDYNLGVSTTRTYLVKKMDGDYFEEEWEAFVDLNINYYYWFLSTSKFITNYMCWTLQLDFNKNPKYIFNRYIYELNL
jgi:hypothetical protein